MKTKIVYFCFGILLLSSCHNNNNELAGTIGDTVKVINIKPKSKLTVSGKYDDISLAVDSGLITGVYEYYDQMDPITHEFLQANVFFIFMAFLRGIVHGLMQWCQEVINSLKAI